MQAVGAVHASLQSTGRVHKCYGLVYIHVLLHNLDGTKLDCDLYELGQIDNCPFI